MKRGDPDDKESAIDSDEYQDMVFDIEYGKALMNKADNFLQNKPAVDWSSDTGSQLKDG